MEFWLPTLSTLNITSWWTATVFNTFQVLIIDLETVVVYSLDNAFALKKGHFNHMDLRLIADVFQKLSIFSWLITSVNWEISPPQISRDLPLFCYSWVFKLAYHCKSLLFSVILYLPIAWVLFSWIVAN